MRRDARGEDETAGNGVDAGGEAIHHRPVLHERRHGIAHRDEVGTDLHGRMLGNHLVCQLHRGLRTRLIIMEDEFERTALDSAILVDPFLGELQRLLLGCAEERSAPGQRQDGVDLIGLRRHGRSGQKRAHGDAER
jgi:hypothetical protein